MPSTSTLTPEQTAHFLERGHIVLHDCFSPAVAEDWKDLAFQRLGYDRQNRATWEKERIHMGGSQSLEIKEFAPKAWQAICALLGGEDRIKQPARWSDGFIVNFHEGSDQPWQGPSPQSKGWHKDGDFFRHFLDSPEQGLLTLVIWSDIEPQGGGTFLAWDSVPVVARFLRDHPEGVGPYDFDFKNLVGQCREFVEMTGRVGDVVLLHPYMLHTVSQNHSDRARFITNPPVSLTEPMNFHRADPADYSLVEQAILNGLGVASLDFHPTNPRESLVPERVHRQAQEKREEAQRLAKIAS